uniref:Tryptophan synthase alpha chain n=1 Tax=Nitophyllum punctatum TaxID=158729 RepID=A0A4D6WVE1_9FLOR|nr:Tryptophan synthase alpha subunit [Nitophyllum punctatum]
MNVISNILINNRQKSYCSLIPFITAGYPSIEMTLKILYQLDAQGADIIELGLPYSDALADGPLIQKSSELAIKQGFSFDDMLTILNTVTSNLKAPIVVFTYYNPVLVRGLDKFVCEISCNGAKGLIVPDLPIEETDYLIYLCSIYNIELILFIAPNSSNKRISMILSKSPGCLYLVSSKGVTGLRSNINISIKAFSSSIKSRTEKLLMLGFGISSPEQVSELINFDIDGIVIGSAFIQILVDTNLDNKSILNKIGSFCYTIKNACSRKR